MAHEDSAVARSRHGGVPRWLVPVAAAIAHAPSLANRWTLDDAALLVENPYLRSASGLPVLLSREMFMASAEPALVPYYRPLSSLLYWVSYQLLGASAPLQHALNVLLHAMVASLLAVSLERLGSRRTSATACGVLFAVHPAGAEVVAYIGGRQDMLGWLCALVGLVAVAGARTNPQRALSALAGTLGAVLAREFFVAWPLALGAAAALAGGGSQRLRRALAALVGGGAAVLAVAGLRRALGLIAMEPPSAPPFTWLRATAAVGLRLMRDLVAPIDLAHAVTPSLPSLGTSVSALVSLAGVFAAGFVWLRRRAPDSLALYASGITLLGIGFVAHAAVLIRFGNISDRYAYVVLVGAALAGTPLASAMAASSKLFADGGLGGRLHFVPFAVSLALLPLTWSRCLAWQDETALIAAMVDERPSDPETQLAFAGLLLEREGLDAAYPHCLRFAKARPESDKAAFCVGAWLLAHGKPDEAAIELERYVVSSPGFAPARRALLAALLASGRVDDLERWLAKLEPDFAGASELIEARAELARRQAPR